MVLLLGIYRSNKILISDIVVNRSLYNYFKGGQSFLEGSSILS